MDFVDANGGDGTHEKVPTECVPFVRGSTCVLFGQHDGKAREEGATYSVPTATSTPPRNGPPTRFVDAQASPMSTRGRLSEDAPSLVPFAPVTLSEPATTAPPQLSLFRRQASPLDSPRDEPAAPSALQ